MKLNTYHLIFYHNIDIDIDQIKPDKKWIILNYKLTVNNFSSLESSKAGNIWQYFSMDALATSMSRQSWQRDALNKYSRALYFSRELSKATAATFKNEIRINSIVHIYFLYQVKKKSTIIILFYFWKKNLISFSSQIF